MTYEEKLKIANEYLRKNDFPDWDDLGDINSLHDCDTVEEIEEAAKERVDDEGFDFND